MPENERRITMIFQSLIETEPMMESADYKERFRAEYFQTKIRYQKLHQMLVKHGAGTLSFAPLCSLELLTKQAKAMGEYLYCLEVRAQVEDIPLD
ncbi:MAG: hypothetical protein PHI27_03045 [Eubacteriales bacterium]|nr:hypothetical protein [Eubacteriales bacterium]MDD3881212.1 hypothetical protein [Eubacteriales bacterium]MDD4512130.1 hypothetical protein [Eubacteriales bacterium]